MEAKKIRELKQGEVFQRQDRETAPKWVRGEYCRQNGKYSVYPYEDVNEERFIHGGTKVYV